MEQIGRMLVIVGLVTAGFGLLLMAGERFPFLGRLPGTITISRDNVTIVIPVLASIVLSLVLTLVLNLVLRR
jgi:hypothetical protein